MYTSPQFCHSKQIPRTNSKSKLGIKQPSEKTLQETGLQFTNTKQQSFSFEVQAERQYVHRLKMQREKIQALYTKYDLLLEEMKKKDQKIREQQRLISQLNLKCKDYSLLMPELDILRKQNAELFSDNQAIRYNLAGIEQSYLTSLNDYKSKSTLSERERQKLQQFNEQLLSKLRIMQQKFEDKHKTQEKETKQWSQKMEQKNKQLHDIKNKHINQLAVLNGEILHREEQIDILHKEVQRIKQSLFCSEQSNINLCRDHDEKIQRISSDFKQKLRSVKQQIQQNLYNNEILTNKINCLNLQIQKLSKQNLCLLDKLSTEKQTYEQHIYQLKMVANQQKSILREHVLQLESKIAKLEKQLADSMRRERDLVSNIKKFQQNQQVKRSLRDVERRQIEKINRLLLIDK